MIRSMVCITLALFALGCPEGDDAFLRLRESSLQPSAASEVVIDLLYRGHGTLRVQSSAGRLRVAGVSVTPDAEGRSELCQRVDAGSTRTAILELAAPEETEVIVRADLFLGSSSSTCPSGFPHESSTYIFRPRVDGGVDASAETDAGSEPEEDAGSSEDDGGTEEDAGADDAGSDEDAGPEDAGPIDDDAGLDAGPA